VSTERSDDHDLPAECARAYEMRAAGHSVRRIAEQLGFSVGTADARIRAAERAAEFIDSGAPDRHAESRGRAIAAIEAWQSRLDNAYGKGEPLAELADVLGKVAAAERTKAAIGGYTARIGVDLGATRTQPAPNPAVVEAVRRQFERNEVDCARIAAGHPDVAA
jgi:cell pole-organizing protein PopZ